MKYEFTCQTKLGAVTLTEKDGAITGCRFGEALPSDAVAEETELLKKAAEQLDEYFNGTRKAFDLPLAPEGTLFQKAVWNALLAIPYGETRSYKQIASAVGNEKACRAVGMANNRNPIGIIIPCHRVIGSNGKLIGYDGGLDYKERLLLLEKQPG